MSVSIRWIGDSDGTLDHLKRAARSFDGTQISVEGIPLADQHEALREAVERMTNSDDWLEFCILLLDIKFGKSEYGGFEVLKGLRAAFKLDGSDRATDAALPKPWRHIFVGSIHAGAKASKATLIQKAKAELELDLVDGVNLFELSVSEKGYQDLLKQAVALCKSSPK